MSRPKKLTNDDGSLFIPKRLLSMYNRQTEQMQIELNTMSPETARFWLEHEYEMKRIYAGNHGAFDKIAAAQADKAADVMSGKGWGIPSFLKGIDR